MNLLAAVDSNRPITNGIEELFMSPYWGFLFELEYSPSDSSRTAAASAQVPSEESPRVLVGTETMRDELIFLLMKADGQLEQKQRVISIVGCRGLGKKTLAKEVHRKLKEEFDCAALVEMTPNCSTNEVLRKILSEVSQQELNIKKAWRDRQLISKIYEFLEDKRYFITVSEVHSASSWSIIKEAFPENKRSNRIMTTTCINSIANACCPHTDDLVYEMKSLTSTDSESLFQLRVSSEVVEVYNDILKMSGYTPLAVISLASVLAKKESTRKAWEEVRNSLCLAPETGNYQVLEERIKSLSHSYFDLPLNVKACALYLSMLPVQYTIDRDWLVRKWIAEGFVHEEIGLGPEDIAKNYLHELLNRNFIQAVECSNSLLVDRYQVHFMMLYLLKSIAKQEEFVTLLHASDVHNSLDKMNRRLSVYNPKPQSQDQSHTLDHTFHERKGNGSIKADKVDLSHIRSINIFDSATGIDFKVFHNVQVLDLEGCIGVDNADMKDICCMLLLKYLGLKETQVSELPQEIKNLHHLETLDMRKTKVKKLPKEVVLVRNLVNLLVGDSDIHHGLELPEGTKNLKFLRVVGIIDLREHSSNILLELGELTELRELEIVLHCDGLTEKQNDILSLLRKYSSLQSLVIYGDFACSMDMQLASHPLLQKLRVSRRFVKVPLWISKLVYLTQLDIRVCKLEGDNLDSFRRLPSLQRFILGLEILPKKQPILISGTGFVSLDAFCFDCKMPCLSFQQGAMPKLKHLELKFYGGLATQIPSGVNQLITLRKIVLQYPRGYEGNAGVKETIDAIKREADEHVNYISLYRNGMEESFPWKFSADKGKQKVHG
ncbi:unnamed protein product [Urochloa decumbens]